MGSMTRMRDEVLQKPWHYDGQGVNVSGDGPLSGTRLVKLQDQDFPIEHGSNLDRELFHEHLVNLHNEWLKNQHGQPTG